MYITGTCDIIELEAIASSVSVVQDSDSGVPGPWSSCEKRAVPLEEAAPPFAFGTRLCPVIFAAASRCCCAASWRTRASNSTGTSRRFSADFDPFPDGPPTPPMGDGSCAMRSKLRHYRTEEQFGSQKGERRRCQAMSPPNLDGRTLSFRSTAERCSMAGKPSFLMSAHRPPPHRATPSTRASDSASAQGLCCLLFRPPLVTPPAAPAGEASVTPPALASLYDLGGVKLGRDRFLVLCRFVSSASPGRCVTAGTAQAKAA
jgi:hypothetical protein